MIVTIANVKGGTGKTNVALNLACGYSNLSLINTEMNNKKVLVIDLDGQANLTRLSGVKHKNKRTIYECLKDPKKIKNCIYKTRYGFELIPAKADLFSFGSLSEDNKKSLELLDVIKEVKDQYDLIFIDTNPALNDLTTGAVLTAALQKGVVIVVGDTVTTSEDGYRQLIEKVQEPLARKYRIKSTFLYLINKTLNQKYDNQRVKSIQKKLTNKRCLQTTIREDSSTIRKANDLNKAVIFRKKPIGDDFKNLVKELVERGIE